MTEAFNVTPSFVETMRTFLAEMIPAEQLHRLRHQYRPGADDGATVIMVPTSLTEDPETFELLKRAFYMTHLHSFGSEIRLVCPIHFGDSEGTCGRVSAAEGIRGVTCGCD